MPLRSAPGCLNAPKDGSASAVQQSHEKPARFVVRAFFFMNTNSIPNLIHKDELALA
jgi:hypothetical protein